MRCLWLLFIPALLFGGAPQRVVSQTVGTDELLVALAEPAQIAALSHLSRDPEYCAVAQEAARFPQLQEGDAEAVLRHRPELVLVSSYTRPELLAQLRRSGTRIFSFDRFNTLEEVYAGLRTLGDLLGTRPRAEALIRACEARVAALKARLNGVTPKRVLVPSVYGFTAGKETTFQDLCEHAGAVNVAAEAGLRGHAPTPSEAMLTWKVDALVVAREDSFDKLKSLPPFKFMEVTRAGRYVTLPGVLLSSVTHHRVTGYEALAKALHPERFR
jgi:iron complex transport system substrate-binding protein